MAIIIPQETQSPNFTPTHQFFLDKTYKTIVDARSGKRHTIALTERSIKIGCAEITVEALEYILQKHAETFKRGEVII